MADSKALINWFLSNSDKLDLQATKLEWPALFQTENIFDFEVTLTINGKKELGRGTAATEELAFLKAGAEAIERSICTLNRIPTEGVAVHTDEEKARAGAINEFIERDSLFCYFYSRTAFSMAPENVIVGLKAAYFNIFSKTEAAGFRWSFYRASMDNTSIVVCICSGELTKQPLGARFGLGASSDIKAAARSSFLECIRNVAVEMLGESKAPALTVDQFNKLPSPTSWDRLKLARNVEYWHSLKFLFGEIENPIPHKLPRIKIENLSALPALLAEAPIFCYRATLDDSYEANSNDLKYPVNLARLCEFTNQSLEVVKSNLLNNNFPPIFLG